MNKYFQLSSIHVRKSLHSIYGTVIIADIFFVTATIMYSYMGTNHPDLLSNRNEAAETGPSQQNVGEGTPLVRFIENRDGKF